MRKALLALLSTQIQGRCAGLYWFLSFCRVRGQALHLDPLQIQNAGSKVNTDTGKKNCAIKYLTVEFPPCITASQQQITSRKVPNSVPRQALNVMNMAQVWNAANAWPKSKWNFQKAKTQIKQIHVTDMVKHLVEHGWGEAWKAHSAEVILPGSYSVNAKHTNTRVNVELFGVGVILWNTINLSNLLRLCSDCQHAERPTHAPSSVSEPVENV